MDAKEILSMLDNTSKETLITMANICLEHFTTDPDTGDEYSEEELKDNNEYNFLQIIFNLNDTLTEEK